MALTAIPVPGYPRPQVDEDLRGRLEAKLIISILDFDLS